MNTDALELIETKLAYLERANRELSEVVYRQHRDIETLRQQLIGLAVRLDGAQSAAETRSAEDERPPHY